jgi:hypothetical protein
MTNIVKIEIYWNQGPIKYLLWHNGEKPHRSIGKLPPLLYYVNNFIGHQKSNILEDYAKYAAAEIHR